MNLSSRHCETTFSKRKSLKPCLLNVVPHDLAVVFDVQVPGRAQDEGRELFKQKNAASAGMKKSSYAASGILR